MLNGLSSRANDIALQADSMIIIAGEIQGAMSTDFFVMRLHPDGTPDSLFGNGGIVMADLVMNSGDVATSLLIQPDGKIVLGGWTFTNDKDLALARFNSDGSPDTTFGTVGVSTYDIGGVPQEINDMVLQADGKIVVTGYQFDATVANEVLVARFLPDGSIDSSFGNAGVAIPAINTDDDEGNAIALQADGRIIVAGFIYVNFTFAENLVMRFDTNGALDPTFNGSGYVITSYNADNWSNAVMLQPDGKIVTAGTADQDIGLSRFLSNGNIDSTFGTYGRVTMPIGIEYDIALAGMLQPDGKIVLGGYYSDSGLENIYIARFNNDSTITSVNTVAEMTSPLIYPSPATDYLTIEPGRLSHDGFLVSVRNIHGQVVSVTKCSGMKNMIDISNLPEGIYMISMKENENYSAGKFIKKK